MKQKKFMKKLMMLVVAVVVCMIPAMVNAASYINNSAVEVKNNKTYILTGDGNGKDTERSFYMPQIDTYMGKGWKIKSQKVNLSNKNTVKARTTKDSSISLTYKRTGTTKVTVKTVMSKNGKKDATIIYKFTLKTQKFVNPVVSLKVNGKEAASTLKKNTYGTIKANGKKKVKFTCKLRNGWKVMYKNEFNVEYETGEQYKYRYRTVKSGGTIDMTLYKARKSGVLVYTKVENTKTGQVEEVVLRVLP